MGDEEDRSENVRNNEHGVSGTAIRKPANLGSDPYHSLQPRLGIYNNLGNSMYSCNQVVGMHSHSVPEAKDFYVEHRVKRGG